MASARSIPAVIPAGAAAHYQCVEFRIVEPLRRDAHHADRGAEGAARLGQQTHVIDRPISLFAHSKAEITAQLITSKPGEDETDALHGASSRNVSKRRIYDI